MPKYLIKTIKIFSLDYIVEAKNESDALNEINNNEDVVELSQKYISNVVIESSEIPKEEFIKLFNKEYPELHYISDKEMSSFIHRVNYDDWEFS